VRHRTLRDTHTDKALPPQNGLYRRKEFLFHIYLENVSFRAVAQSSRHKYSDWSDRST